MPPPNLAPFRLSEGVFLEDSGILLPWRAHESVFAVTADPTPQPGGNAGFTWYRRKAFGGLDVTIRRSDCYRQAFGISFPSVQGDALVSGRDAWEPVLEVLTRAFGRPHETGNNDDMGPNYPYAQWRWGAVTLRHMIWEWHADMCSASVSRIEDADPTAA